MNRIIKFRGRSLSDTDKWHYGNLIKWENGDCMIWCEKNGVILKFAVDTQTIGQFTGLYDKNGKEIYEGDIFGIETDDKRVLNKFYRIVSYCLDGFYLACKDNYGDKLHLMLGLSANPNWTSLARCLRDKGFDYCIIGNIHDNPELLKTE